MDQNFEVPADFEKQVNLLLIPHRGTEPGKLSQIVNDLIGDCDELPWCIYNQSVVNGRFDLETLVTKLLPLSKWWKQSIAPYLKELIGLLRNSKTDHQINIVLGQIEGADGLGNIHQASRLRSIIWLVRVLDICYCSMKEGQCQSTPESLHSALDLLEKATNDVALEACLLYTSPSPRDQRGSRMPSSA